MAHLTGFGLENFRIFKEHTWFDFAPITILVGPNSSGKSSLIKALLLLKDNYERDTLFTKTPNSILRFDGGLHSLSSGKNILNNNSEDNQFKFDFEYKAEGFTVRLKYEFIFETKDDISYKYPYISVKTETDELLFRLTSGEVYLNIPRLLKYLNTEDDILQKIDEKGIEKYCDDLSDYFFFDLNLKASLEKIQLFRNFFDSKIWKFNSVSFNDFYNEHKPFIRQQYIGIEDEDGHPMIDEKEISYENFVEETITGDYVNWCKPIFNVNGREWLTAENSAQATKAFHAILELLLLETNEKAVDISTKFSSLEDIIYLPSIKGQIKRSYQANEDHVINSLIKRFKESSTLESQEELNKWQKLFGIEEIAINRDDRLDVNYITVGGRSLTDLGFGLSQLAALFIMISLRDKVIGSDENGRSRNGNIFLLEEPESNLHPKYQSLLADVFCESIFANQFIIETHSEYMIRKFQYLVAKGKMKPEDIVIYYFNDPNNIPSGEKQVKKINVLEDGNLSDDFGPGFFDEAAHWELELLKLKKNRTRQN